MKKAVKQKVVFIRVPETLHQKLRIRAAMKGVTLQDFLLKILEKVK